MVDNAINMFHTSIFSHSRLDVEFELGLATRACAVKNAAVARTSRRSYALISFIAIPLPS